MKKSRRPGLPGLLVAAALTLASCGSEDMQGMEEGGGAGATQAAPETTGRMGGGSSSTEEDARVLVAPNGEYSDAAFVDAMVPHHEGAVEMAEVAIANAEHKEIRVLAQEIVDEQRAEIEEFGRLRGGLGGGTTMRMSGEEMDEMMGMSEDPRALAEERPFDRAFIDAMIPHHESAIAMANVAVEESQNPEIREIAEGIISSQEREISQMRQWREEWYPEG